MPDATESAYGAVVYMRSLREDGTTTTKLIGSKSRVATNQGHLHSSPELSACLLLAQLVGKAPEHKWQFEKENVTPNSMAILKDENLPPCKWTMGRILEIVKGSDGKVRVVKVKTPQGIF
ncbi:DUF5641 domain-containing protein [Trichonephila clavipes]|nr:DUF5641 domain-containing protein [Trichonephila clavipes]